MEIPERPPAKWFEEKYKEVKEGLRKAHPKWKEETLDERTRMTVGDIWHNKLSPSKKREIMKKYESVADDEEDYVRRMQELEEEEEELEEEEQIMDDLMTKIKADTKAISDGLDRREASKKDGSPDFISVPAFKIPYVATPKFEGKDGPVIVKAVVLEEPLNINNWRVVAEEFPKVADQYKAGRQLRLNHGKDVQDIIGRSFDGKVVKGKELEMYLGKKIDGVNPEGMYVTAEFEASPQDPQVRTNILNGYVETGSIGLDAEAYCEVCDKPLKMQGEMFDRTCKHFDAPIKLKNVEVKEYSYVAEPAFQHTVVYPSFSAAVSQIRLARHEDSSVIETPVSVNRMEMSEQPSKVEAIAKVKEGEGESDADAKAKAYAEAVLEAYRKGFADAESKFRVKAESEGKCADAEGEGKKKAEAKASTDQKMQVTNTATAPVKPSLIERVTRPTETAMLDPAMRELFSAAAGGPTTPADIKARFRGVFK